MQDYTFSHTWLFIGVLWKYLADGLISSQKGLRFLCSSKKCLHKPPGRYRKLYGGGAPPKNISAFLFVQDTIKQHAKHTEIFSIVVRHVCS